MIDYAKLASVDFSNAEMEDFEERAAIIEHDGGYSKNEAEKQAYMTMLAERDKRECRPPTLCSGVLKR